MTVRPAPPLGPSLTRPTWSGTILPICPAAGLGVRTLSGSIRRRCLRRVTTADTNVSDNEQ